MTLGINLELRPMVKEDIPRVMEIERECFPVPWQESAYYTEISNRSAYYVVALVDDFIVGYAGMWLIVDEAHITTLGVARSHRGLNIGERLLIALLDESMRRNAHRATLEVRKSNLVAQGLYKKYSFIPAAIRKGYYTDNGEDAIVMWIDNLYDPVFLAKYRSMKKRTVDATSASAGGVA